MKDVMTSGEIAREAGVSQKALRIYDEKGLLRPVGYSEGNYKLYDKSSLMILEKIIALKHVGFSLEEIKSNLEEDNQETIEETLRNQLALMEKKIYEMQKSADCIKVALARLKEDPDWDNVADVIRKMEMAQAQDERRWYAADHAADGIEWYVKIFDSLDFHAGEDILDLGCSYGLLWRENWDRIPENFVVDGVDIHESWADDLAEYLEEQKDALPKGTRMQVKFENLEEDQTWDDIYKKKYDRIIMHYLLSYFENPEVVVEKASKALKDGGMLSYTYVGTSVEHDYWEKFFSENGFDKSVSVNRRTELTGREDELIDMVSGCFSRVEKIRLKAPISYDDSELLFERVLRRYPGSSKYLTSVKGRMIEFFDKMIEKDGVIIVDSDTTFMHCYK